MGHVPCKTDPDIWLKNCGEYYECIAVHVDDLLIGSKDPQRAIDILINNRHFKLKGTGPMPCRLGCDFVIDEYGTLHFAPKMHRKDGGMLSKHVWF